MHSGNERRWKRCSQSSRIRSDFAACAYVESNSFGNNSSWRQPPPNLSKCLAASNLRGSQYFWLPSPANQHRQNRHVCSKFIALQQNGRSVDLMCSEGSLTNTYGKFTDTWAIKESATPSGVWRGQHRGPLAGVLAVLQRLQQSHATCEDFLELSRATFTQLR